MLLAVTGGLAAPAIAAGLGAAVAVAGGGAAAGAAVAGAAGEVVVTVVWELQRLLQEVGRRLERPSRGSEGREALLLLPPATPPSLLQGPPPSRTRWALVGPQASSYPPPRLFHTPLPPFSGTAAGATAISGTLGACGAAFAGSRVRGMVLEVRTWKLGHGAKGTRCLVSGG